MELPMHLPVQPGVLGKGCGMRLHLADVLRALVRQVPH
ncbi:hypothetical protein LEMLEM_LOCUS27262 [Lemmus lemmus]